MGNVNDRVPRVAAAILWLSVFVFPQFGVVNSTRQAGCRPLAPDSARMYSLSAGAAPAPVCALQEVQGYCETFSPGIS
jgi:hypothetical protein